ncbi:MAG: glycosyltransferase [Ferruginibacter sp.]|nr:glycosyltransferase [Ferruginibacter sp.]
MPKLLFVYDYFYPAYKAGGPIQSLTNLVKSLEDKHEICVFTGSNDHNSSEKLPGIDTGKWTSVTLPGSDKPLQVWYAKPQTINRSIFGKMIKEVRPDVVYLNGIFSYRFFIIPLLCVNPAQQKIVIAPRGMLQSGALAGKALKKKAYLGMLKMLGMVRSVNWHATTEDEKEDIIKIFGKKAKVIVASNIPRQPVNEMRFTEKKEGRLRLVYLSLIAEKKNLLQLIELVNNAAAGITLDIYGPVKDESYWKKCLQAIGNDNTKIIYKADRSPELVQQTFEQYDASVLLTNGENFGHALFESLSAGRPIITSFFTPWNGLEEKKAGWNFDIGDAVSCRDKLGMIAGMDAASFNSYCTGAYNLAKAYYNNTADLKGYNELFG